MALSEDIPSRRAISFPENLNLIKSLGPLLVFSPTTGGPFINKAGESFINEITSLDLNFLVGYKNYKGGNNQGL
ncbi:MAG: hypothetical protein JXQ90_23045 [Cyclobacteriaceae bacterium]